MTTHSSVLAWRIPGTAEPGGLLSMGSHRVGYDRSNLAAAADTGGWEVAVMKWMFPDKPETFFIYKIVTLGIDSV